jgi:15-cis-phytoene synthase
MSRPADTLQASYAACRRMSCRAQSSFYAAFLLLPPGKRRAMDALYAFMRHSDDLVDRPRGDRPPEQVLAEWRAAVEQVLANPTDATAQEIGNSSPLHLDFLPALADTVHRFRVPPGHLLAVLDGVEMDLRPRRYQTFEELEEYCSRVAAAVGLACIHVWGFRGPEALKPARQGGIAFQLTNILRDLKEDAVAGRVYLPLDDLSACGCPVEDLQRGVAGPGFYRLMDLEIGRAEQYYQAAAQLSRWLEPDGRRIFGLMMATYRALLAKIKRRPGDVLRGRVRLGRVRKLWIAARWTLFPPKSAEFV